jgi:hypothetical protein
LIDHAVGAFHARLLASHSTGRSASLLSARKAKKKKELGREQKGTDCI